MRGEVLNDAFNTINGNKTDIHGNPEDCFSLISELWSQYLGIEISRHDVMMLMALLKISRIKSGTKTDKSYDSYIDALGYIALASDEIKDKDCKKCTKV